MQRTIKDYTALFFKGVLMGAADAVPGVSGGTIAFITGIYQELISSISAIDLRAVKVLLQQGPKRCWTHINGAFLSTLLLGILSSLIVLSNLVLLALSNYPEILWAGFFGLILASSVVMAKQIKHWNMLKSAAFVTAAALAWALSGLGGATIEPSYLNVFFAGAVAICAMILPGISGSFILLLLGMYAHILGAVKDVDLIVLFIFAMGCVSGLLSFSKLLSWLFNRYRDITLALLTGFLLGSLAKVWPWKQVLNWRINSKGVSVADQQQNISPFNYESLTGTEPFLIYALLAAVLGAVIVLLIERGQN